MHLRTKQSIRWRYGAQPDERHENRQLLYWSGMTDTMHTIFGSNEDQNYF